MLIGSDHYHLSIKNWQHVSLASRIIFQSPINKQFGSSTETLEAWQPQSALSIHTVVNSVQCSYQRLSAIWEIGVSKMVS